HTYIPSEIEIPFGVGPVTCLATISGSGQVYSGHENGKVVIWSIGNREKVKVINVHAYKITSLLGVGNYLWVGFSTGKIYVLDMSFYRQILIKNFIDFHLSSHVLFCSYDMFLGGIPHP